jgi:hypothetical protein
MFKITTPAGVTVLTENPNWIRVHAKNPNCFLLCQREKAEGVAYKGSPFLFAEGTMVHEVDGGDEFAALIAENESLRAQLAETEEAAIELFEATLDLEAINAEQDEAIIEIYETMEGMING